MRDDFDGPDLLVGEIAAIRTFDLRADGSLWPVFAANRAWQNGDNEALCAIHEVAAAPGCKCGFWAYGSAAALKDQPAAHNVAAVVSCWGRVTPGTRGLRARFARLDAVWLSRRVPSELVTKVATRYPDVTIYRDRRVMLAEHPLTQLPSYSAPHRKPSSVRIARSLLRLITALALLAGVLPRDQLQHQSLLSGLHYELILVLVTAGISAGVRALNCANSDRRRAILFTRAALRIGALLLWIWAPYCAWYLQLFMRLPVVLWIGRILIGRTVRYLPTRVPGPGRG